MPRWASQIPIARTDAQAVGAAFADQRGDRPGVVERRGRRQLDVEGDQWRASSHEDRAGGRMQAARSEVGALLAVPDPLREGGEAATSQLSARAPAREIAVEEHGKLEPLAEHVREDQRLRGRGAAVCVVQVDDRRNIDRADARMRSLVAGDVDGLQRAPRTGEDRGRDLTGRAGERKHRAVVVRIEVDVDRARAERGADRVDRRLVAPLGEVGDGEQRGRHAPSSPST